MPPDSSPSKGVSKPLLSTIIAAGVVIPIAWWSLRNEEAPVQKSQPNAAVAQVTEQQAEPAATTTAPDHTEEPTDQFAKWLKTASFDELMAMLRKKLAT